MVGHEPGKGQNAGKCGALTLETPDGRRFSCGSGLTDKVSLPTPPRTARRQNLPLA